MLDEDAEKSTKTKDDVFDSTPKKKQKFSIDFSDSEDEKDEDETTEDEDEDGHEKKRVSFCLMRRLEIVIL